MHLASRGANQQVIERYRQAKATKCGGMDGEEPERLLLPMKRGNPVQETPWREKGRRKMDPLEGKMTESLNSDDVSTKRKQVAELARQALKMDFMSLAHHIDIDFLRAATILISGATRNSWPCTAILHCCARFAIAV